MDTMRKLIEQKRVDYLRELYRDANENTKRMFKKTIEIIKNESLQEISNIKRKYGEHGTIGGLRLPRFASIRIKKLQRKIDKLRKLENVL